MTAVQLRSAIMSAFGIAHAKPAKRTTYKPHRTSAPVRRGSRERGTFEAGWYRPLDHLAGVKMRQVVEDYDIEHTEPGARRGPLGPFTCRVFNVMVGMVDKRTGQLDPTIATIMAKTRLCRQTVQESITRLCEHGFLERQRRCVRSHGEGPRFKQTSNAYRITCPPALRSRLGRRGARPPIPDDHAQRVAEDREAVAAMMAGLPCGEFARLQFDDPGSALARTLTSFGEAVDRRYSANLLARRQPDALDILEEKSRSRPGRPTRCA